MGTHKGVKREGRKRESRKRKRRHIKKKKLLKREQVDGAYLQESLLFVPNVIKRNIKIICVLVYKHGMSVTKRASSHVLAADTHVVT